MAIVISGILAFRMHAFLALIFAAFSVSILTSPEKILQYSLNSYTVGVVSVYEDSIILSKKPTEGRIDILKGQ